MLKPTKAILNVVVDASPGSFFGFSVGDKATKLDVMSSDFGGVSEETSIEPYKSATDYEEEYGGEWVHVSRIGRAGRRS